MIDLRSDTVTKPTAAMRRAMADAEVGDDVLEADPTVDQLQRRIAEMLGHEAALFMPSGTMCNQVAVRLHCQPGDEIICDAECHVVNYEQAGFAQLSGVAVRVAPADAGVLQRDELDGLVRGDDEHLARTRLVSLENTHNRGGGCVWPYPALAEICQWARQRQLATHLDGARLFNAVVASGIPAARWAQHFDTISVCFSKGLGAPVGSALVGSKALMARARRHRKVLGGGMRQAGIIAAGALYALEHHVERLADDHAAAQLLAQTVGNEPALRLDPPRVDTNIVIFHVPPQLATADEFCQRLHEAGVWMLPFGAQHVRACTHLDVSPADVERAGRIIIRVAEELARHAQVSP
jgi:threonine aldolase